MRQNAMAASVTRKKVDLPPGRLAGNDHIRRRAEWRFDKQLARFGNAFQLIKPAPSNDADARFLHVGGKVKTTAEMGSAKVALSAERFRMPHVTGAKGRKGCLIF